MTTGGGGTGAARRLRVVVVVVAVVVVMVVVVLVLARAWASRITETLGNDSRAVTRGRNLSSLLRVRVCLTEPRTPFE